MKRWSCLLVLLVFFCTGCSLDVESYLFPPRPGGEQWKIQQALETYIKAHGDKGGRYVLKYPKTGEYTSAFIVRNLSRNKEIDMGEVAVAFYRMGAETGNTHINILRLVEGKWQSVSDVEGLSTDVDKVSFADLNGDGIVEMIAGWSIYNSRDRQLFIYSLTADDRPSWQVDGVCTNFFTGSITSEVHDDLLQLRIGSDNQVSAYLYAMEGGSFKTLGSVSLDGYIQQFGNISTGVLTNRIRGVYVDAHKDANTMITELLYWDGHRLAAPLYNAISNTNTLTARESGLPSMDIDGDGQTEWPKSKRLPGYYETKEPKEYMWWTDWYAWDYQTGKSIKKMATLVNASDGYTVLLDDSWDGHITTDYHVSTRTLWLKTITDGKAGAPFLGLRTVAQGQPSASMQEDPAFIFQRLDGFGDDTVTYYVWYDPHGAYELNMEKIRYMISRLQ